MPNPSNPGPVTSPEPGPVMPEPEPMPASEAGQLVLSGIGRISRKNLSLSNEQLKPLIFFRDTGRSQGHAMQGYGTLCNAYVTLCDPSDEETWFFTYSPFNSNMRLPARGILAISTTLSGNRDVFTPGSQTEELVILHASGNDGVPSFFGTPSIFGGVEYNGAEDTFTLISTGLPLGDIVEESLRRVLNAAKEGRFLGVSGYKVVDGVFVPDPRTTRCGGMEEYCLYAPYTQVLDYRGDGTTIQHAGTSFSVLTVEAALAAVWSVFPETSPLDLVKIAKNCAIPLDTLDGLGLADFTCMTRVEGDGFRLVSSEEFTECIADGDECVSSSTVSGTSFPGAVSLGVTVGGVSLSSAKPGTFGLTGFSSGIPDEYGRYNTDLSIYGLTPFGAGSTDSGAFGLVWQDDGWRDNEVFVAAAFGPRDRFFGITSGYSDVISVDIETGIKSFFVRVSHQTAKGVFGSFLQKAKGTAVGFTARKEIIFDDVTFTAMTEFDRFVGGVADTTAFGRLKMGKSGWNRKFSFGASTALADGTFNIGVVNERSGAGKETFTTYVSFEMP